MLVKRIIPCLDVKDGKVVKGVQFRNLREEGDPAVLAEAYGREGADEVVFLDITASYEKRKIILDVVVRTAERLFIPFTVGGGIRSLSDIRDMLVSGADKVSINTGAVESPDLIERSAEAFGSQCIVVAIDAKRVYESRKDRVVVETPQGPCWWEVYVNGGRTPTGIDAVEWAGHVERLGAGEILLTSMDYDGTQMGYDIPLTKKISESVNIPVIASGGAGEPEHIRQVLVEGSADAALAASIFHRGVYPVMKVKEYLAKHGVHVRMDEYGKF
ncbi:MAG: imidazole glycerol phosphate synthase subunit HisF [Candidatus Bathyarchaeia archaeon]